MRPDCEHERRAATPNHPAPTDCIKCGAYLELEAETLGARDHQVEDEWFGRLRAMVMSEGQIDCEAFIAYVRRGLAMGDRLYGDEYLKRCGITEALEEARDLGCYSVLEHQRLEVDVADGLGEDVAEEVRMDLLGAATHAALADFHLRRALHRHREAWAPR